MNAPEELKMWLAVRIDLPMPIGKLAAQVGHGFVRLVLEAAVADVELVKRYQSEGEAKITVQVPNEWGLRRVADECRRAGIPHALVTDAGRTVFDRPTVTVCAFGPRLRSELPAYLRRLRLLSNDEGEAG